MLKRIFWLFIVWRIWLFVPLFFGNFWLAARPGYGYTRLTYFTEPGNPINHFLLSPWGNFDGVYYLLIAAQGYTVNAGFFPLFPLTIRLASSIFGTLLPFDPWQYLVSHVLVTGYFLLALFFLYKLVRIDYPDKIAFRSIIFLLLFPTSFFFISIYTEGLFLLLALASLYFARKGNWVLAGITGALLTATRLVGIAILPVLLCEFFQQGNRASILKGQRFRQIALLVIKGLPIILVPSGLVAYMWFNLLKWGNAFYFIEAQGNFGNSRSVDAIVLIPQTLVRYLKIFTSIPLTQFEWWVALFEVSAFIFASIFLYVVWRQRVRLSYLLFASLCFLVPASSGTFTGLPRYILVLFPLFMALALVKNQLVKKIYVVVSLVLLTLLLMLFSKGYYVAQTTNLVALK